MKALGATILVGALLLALFMAGRPNDELLIDEPDQPEMIPAAQSQAAPQLLFAPCPLTPKNLPILPDRKT